MISANMTAYSTAVGPSSETRNRLIFRVKLCMASPEFCAWRCNFVLATAQPRHKMELSRPRSLSASEAPACRSCAAELNLRNLAPQKTNGESRRSFDRRPSVLHPFGNPAVTRLAKLSARAWKSCVTRSFASRPCDRFAFIEDARRQASRRIAQQRSANRQEKAGDESSPGVNSGD